MASLESHYGSYRIVFRLGGEKFCRSLGTDNERTANAALARVEDALLRLELGQIVLPANADLVTFLLSDGRLEQRPTFERPEIRTVGELLDSFLGSLKAGSLEPTTEHCIRVHARHFRRVLGGSRPLGTIDFSAIQEYIDKRADAPGLNGKKLSATTIKKEIATLNLIWNWAENNKHVQNPLPKKSLRYPKIVDKPPFQTIAEITRKIRLGVSEEEAAELWDAAFLTLPEITQILRTVKARANHSFLYPMFVFAAHTGARRSEMRRSQIEDLDFGHRRIFIRERKRIRGRHSLRSVPMSPFLEGVLKDWLRRHPGGRFTFCLESEVPKSRKERLQPIPLTDDEVGHYFEQVLLGTKWEKLRGWHVFRHSFCSNCAAQGIDQRMINAWVGHQSEQMVLRYRHMIPNAERDAIRQVFTRG